MHSDWLNLVTLLATTNHSGLFERRGVYLLSKIWSFETSGNFGDFFITWPFYSLGINIKSMTNRDIQ